MEKLFKKGKTSQLTSKAFGFVEKEVSKGLTAINTLTKSQESEEETKLEEESKAKVNDNYSNEERTDNGEDQSIPAESKPLQENASLIPPEDHISNKNKEDYNEEEDSKEEELRKNNEKELETVIQNVHAGMSVGLKKEANIGHAESILIEAGNSAAEASEGIVNFIQKYGIQHTMADLGFHIISDLIIDKMVGEVPERYKFIVKTVTIMAVQATMSLITGTPALAPLSVVMLKVDAIKKKLDEVNKKVDIIIEEPMKTAGDHFIRAINHIEAGDYEDSLPEIREAINNSLKAINYISGNKKYIGGMITCTRYLALGDQLMEKYDKKNKVFLPYDILPSQKKNKLKQLTKKHLDTLIATNDQYKAKPGIFARTSTKILMEIQHHDVVDGIVRQLFPFLVPPGSMIPPKYLPAGHIDAVVYNVHKKITFSPKYLGSLLLIWRNEEATHFRVMDGDQLFELPIVEDEEIDISMPTPENLLFSANDGNEIIPTTLSVEDEYPTLVEDWEINEKDDCLQLYNAFSQINRQAPVEKKNQVLWEAAKSGDIDKVTYTINIGAEINSREPAPMIDSTKVGKENKCALHYMAEAGHTECLKRLLELGANPNTEDEFFCTPLHHAARGGHLQSVKFLCQAGANIMAQIGKGITARDMAEDSEIKEYLTQLMD